MNLCRVPSQGSRPVAQPRRTQRRDVPGSFRDGDRDRDRSTLLCLCLPSLSQTTLPRPGCCGACPEHSRRASSRLLCCTELYHRPLVRMSQELPLIFLTSGPRLSYKRYVRVYLQCEGRGQKKTRRESQGEWEALWQRQHESQAPCRRRIPPRKIRPSIQAK